MTSRGSPIAVVFDASGKTFRNDIFPEYKANRPPMPDELRQQVKPIHDIIDAMGIPLLVVPDVEADDVIGTLAAQATATRRRTVISTSDKDMAQLVGEYVTLVNTMSDTALDRDGVFEKYGVHPEHIVDYLALMGDSVDNVPGVPKGRAKDRRQVAEQLRQPGCADRAVRRGPGKGREKTCAPRSKCCPCRERSRPYAAMSICPSPSATWQRRLQTRTRSSPCSSKFEFKAWIEEMGGSLGSGLVEGDYVSIDDLAELDRLVARISEERSCSLAVVTRRSNLSDAEIAGIAVATAPGEAAYVPLGLDLTGPAPLSLTEATDRLKPLMEDSGITKIGHNLKRARLVLARYGIDLRGAAHDTMLESYVLDSVGTRRHNLDDLVDKQVGLRTVRYEDVAGRGAKQLDFAAVPQQEATAYGAGAADATLRLHGVLWPKLSSVASLKALYEEIELPLLSVLARVEQTGALVDAGLLAEQSRELALRMNTLAQEAFEEAGKQFNLGSPKQLREILYDTLGLHRHLRTPGSSRTQTGQRSTAEHVLVELAQYQPSAADHPRLPPGVEAQIHVHRHASQADQSTRRDASTPRTNRRWPLPGACRPRIPTCRTSRFARTRDGASAPRLSRLPDTSWVAADYSQIELRIMAHLSRDEGLLRAFDDRLDIHRATAAEVFGAPLADVTDGQRRSAKAINFGLIYGMSAFGLARQLGIERKLAQEYIDLYFARYPGVHDYMERIRAEAREQGFVETVFGRRLYLPDINARQVPRRQAAERTAINAPMQGTAARTSSSLP